MNMQNAHLPNEEELTDEYTCRFCGSDRCKRTYGPHPANHYAKIECGECERFLKWEPHPDKKDSKRKQQKKLVDRYSKGFCEICLRKAEHIPLPQVLEAHHIIQVEDGGGDEQENIQIVCTPCHKWIHHQRTYLGHYLNSTLPPRDESDRQKVYAEIIQVMSDRGISKRQAINILNQEFDAATRDELNDSDLVKFLAILKGFNVEGAA